MSGLRALISMSDKTGVKELAQAILQFDAQGEIVSTGGTADKLIQGQIPVIKVATVTEFPEIYKGAVKTLHPMIFGGILARRNVDSDIAEAKKHGIGMFTVVVVNLYPFEQTVAQAGITEDEALEQIDIGGPSLLRSAAKRWPWVVVLSDPDQYQTFMDLLAKNEWPSDRQRKIWAARVFDHTAWYDATIRDYHYRTLELEADRFPERYLPRYQRVMVLSKGENGHQPAALYTAAGTPVKSCATTAEQLWGKVPSATNMLDLDAVLETVRDLTRVSKHAAAVVKHNTACGASVRYIAGDNDPADTYEAGREADPESAFGGVMATSYVIDLACAKQILATKVDGIIAPGIEPDALALIEKKRAKGKTPIFIVDQLEPLPAGTMETKGGMVDGIILQERDVDPPNTDDWETVTKTEPTPEQLKLMEFGYLAIRRARSNAVGVVCYDHDGNMVTAGIGTGQTSRVRAAEIALKQAHATGQAKGSILISDGFIPFNDLMRLAAQYEIAGILQPGSSRNDESATSTANRLGLFMVFTGRRFFWH